MTAPQPAVKSYFFGKGFKDLQATIQDAWEFNKRSAEGFAADAERSGDELYNFKKGLYYTAAVAVVVFGTVFFVALSAVHIVILGLVFGLIYCAFSALYLAERAFLLVKNYYTLCPHCGAKAALPEYFCDRPGCGRVHTRLIPSAYGIVSRTCLCGQELPATLFGDRQRLQTRCGACARLLSSAYTPDDRTEKLIVPVIGGPSVGKSAFLFAAIWKLLDEELPKLGYTYDFVEPRNRNNYEAARKNFQNGREPDKTVDRLPAAFNIKITKPDSSRVLYFYDPAGEAFGQSEDLAMQKFHGYLSGCVFLIDPFAIAEVRRLYANELSRFSAALKPSQVALDDTLARMILNLEENFKLATTGRVSFPVAVVINKVDAFGIDREIKKAAAYAQPAEPGSAAPDPVRAQLLEWKQGGFVQTLESRFSKVAYFACSALGRLPDGQPRKFEPAGVLEPLLWVLSQADSKFASQKAMAMSGS